MPQQALDESIESPKHPYWVIFVSAWIVSLPLAIYVNQNVKAYVTGTSADNVGVILVTPVIIPAAILASLLPRRGWIALMIGLFSTPLAAAIRYVMYA